MIYSQSSKYAIRAFVHLAGLPDGQFAMVKTIAEQQRIPVHFLAKILQQLARKGMLKSSKGPTGGFRLGVPAKKVKLIDVVDAVDGLNDYAVCAGGLAECSVLAACPLCDRWKPVHSRIMEFLGRSTIADLVCAGNGKPAGIQLTGQLSGRENNPRESEAPDGSSVKREHA